MNTEDTIRTAIEAYRSRNLDAVQSLIHDDIKFRNNAAGGCNTWEISCACKSEFFDALTMINSEVEIVDYELLEILVDGERAATRQNVTLKSLDTQETVQMEISGFWRVQDGMIVELVEFQDTALIARMRVPST